MNKRTIATFAIAAGMSMVLPVAASARRGGTQQENTAAATPVAAHQVEVEHGTEANEHSQGTAHVSANGTEQVTAAVLSPVAVVTPTSASANITEAEATNIAKAQNPKGVVKAVEHETEEGKDVFEVKFTDGSRVDVLASDGSIVRKSIVAPKTTTTTTTSPSSTTHSGHSEGGESETEAESQNHVGHRQN